MTDRSLGCARCGDCCEEIYLSASISDLEPWTTARLESTPDPSTDEGWAWWISEERGQAAWRDTSFSREQAILHYDPDGERRKNADFIVAHWTENADRTYSCDQFDTVHRTCRVQGEKPPVCSGYPWYGQEPRADRITKEGSRCSYLLDLRPSDRPKNSYPLIPIEVVQRG